MTERATMASITIRNLDPSLKERLRARAAEQGHSMAAEARLILRGVLDEPVQPASENLSDRIHARFAALGGVDLDLPPRAPGRRVPDFE